MKRLTAFLWKTVLPAAVCCAGVFLLMRTELLERIENLAHDEFTRQRARLETTVPADEVALLAIDEASLKDIGLWPWNRDVHGDLMHLLSRVRPAVVAWDILFLEESPADEHFARGLKANRAAVLGAMRYDEDGLTPAAARELGAQLAPLPHVEGDVRDVPAAPTMALPLGPLASAALPAFVDTPPGPDGLRREVPLLVRVGEEIFPTLTLRTLMAYWNVTPDQVAVRLGSHVEIVAPLARRRVPINGGGAYRINYRHDASGVVAHGYSRTLSDLARRYRDKVPVGISGLTGRILLVGQVADGLTDLGPTPLSPLTPLVMVHANAIENILREDYVQERAAPWMWLAAFLACGCGLARFSTCPPPVQAGYALLVPVGFAAAAFLAWMNWSERVPLVGPVAAFLTAMVFMIARRMIVEMRAKQEIKGMFGTYVSREVVDELVAAGRPPQLGGHEAEITAFFSDIESFSTFSEVLTPPRLVELMNEYLTACTDLVMANGGTLDKYIGDAIVAMYGAPIPLPDHPYRACLSALAVQANLERLRQKWTADGNWPPIVQRMRTRIGLNSGRCIVGNMGSRARFNYTMMGDHVNLAARMESGAKSWGTYIMCTEATRAGCVAHGGADILFRPLGRIQVKGRAAAVPVFEVVGQASTVGAQAQECYGLFAQALERFYVQDWDGAETLFRRSVALEPLQPGVTPGVKVNPSEVYLEKVRELRTAGVPAAWDGVFVMKEK